MEEGKCGFCHTGDETNDICGTLYKGNVEGKTIVAHHKCMQYSASLIQYRGTFEEFGGFKKKEVLKEIHRGNQLPCYLCKTDKPKKKRGATSGCALKSCRKTFHYYCVVMNKDTVAKRYLFKKSCNKVVALYRVFCSKAHEKEYRKNIRSEDIVGKNKSDDESSDDDEDEEDQMSDSESGDRTTSPDNNHADDVDYYESDDEPAKKKQKTNDKARDDESGPDSQGMSTNEVIHKTRSQYKALQERNRPKTQLTTSDNEDQYQAVTFLDCSTQSDTVSENDEAVQEGQVSCTCCCSELHNLKRRKLQLEIKLLEIKIRKVDQ